MLMMLGLRAGGFGARAADELLMSHDAGVAGAREAFGSMVADAGDAGVVGGPEASRARAADAHDAGLVGGPEASGAGAADAHDIS